MMSPPPANDQKTTFSDDRRHRDPYVDWGTLVIKASPLHDGLLFRVRFDAGNRLADVWSAETFRIAIPELSQAQKAEDDLWERGTPLAEIGHRGGCLPVGAANEINARSGTEVLSFGGHDYRKRGSQWAPAAYVEDKRWIAVRSFTPRWPPRGPILTLNFKDGSESIMRPEYLDVHHGSSGRLVAAVKVEANHNFYFGPYGIAWAGQRHLLWNLSEGFSRIYILQMPPEETP